MAFDIPVQYSQLPEIQPYNRPMAVRSFWGLVGAQVLLSKNTVRELTFDVTITDKASLQALMNVVAQFDTSLNDGDSGDLTANGITYPNCIFLGFFPSGPAFYDPSGHDYTQFGQVKFLQVGEVAEQENNA